MVESIQRLPEDGLRINQFPMAAHGFFRKYRNLSQWVLIAIFIILPWIKINGLPAILINIPDRRFTFFGLSFWGHDAPLLFFVLASFSLGLLLATSVWGRVWCGWTCPQTITIDGIFRRIETLVEGNHIARKKLYETSLEKEKIIKVSIKWFLFITVSLILSHTFFAYFTGPGNLVSMALDPPSANLTIFLIVNTTTMVILFNFGWFKERLCTVICPYGRLQSVLLDEDSLVVAYDEKRGEPRKGSNTDSEETGDCINCFKCVAVCPTGIDIRRGIQMECIACTSCIDACDEIMRITKKPKGLIRYESENGLKGEKTVFWKMKTNIYLGLTLLSVIGLFLFIFYRSGLDITVLRAHEKPYQVLETSKEKTLIANHFTLNLKNQSAVKMEVDIIRTENSEGTEIEIIAPTLPVTIPPGEAKKNHIFIKFPKSMLEKESHQKFQLQVMTKSKDITRKYIKEITLVGPL
ncbi:MAG: cytochrome c oxidase accessory protein CcoG [Candidatus Brocadiales bacterium]|nr:cytochrome c oxidase accessory protein CcoG [Candidatus Brocadiales bacterium]